MKSTSIRNIKARQILDCMGRPAIEVDVITKGGALGRGSAPTGRSVGTHEAFVLRDNDLSCFMGMSVFKAINNIEQIIKPALLGMDVMEQEIIDQRLIELDGTPNKSRLGGNAIYSVSLACLEAAARTMNLPLYKYMAPHELKTIPLPTFNTINGGHYHTFSLAFQEYTAVPYKAKSIMEAVEIGCVLFYTIGEMIKSRQGGKPAGIGNYWGWAPPSNDPRVIFEIIQEAAEHCGVADKLAYALDCACSQMYNSKRGTYTLMGREVDSDEILGLLQELTTKYNFLYVEDPVDENDWDGWQKAVKLLDRTIIVGDDLTVTNIEKLKKAFALHAIEAFIFKPNQIGTITECLAAHEYAKAHGILTIPSIRAGGIVNDAVMDMAVALETCATKQGPPRTGERTYAINFLLRAADENPKASPYDFTKHAKF